MLQTKQQLRLALIRNPAASCIRILASTDPLLFPLISTPMLESCKKVGHGCPSVQPSTHSLARGADLPGPNASDLVVPFLPASDPCPCALDRLWGLSASLRGGLRFHEPAAMFSTESRTEGASDSTARCPPLGLGPVTSPSLFRRFHSALPLCPRWEKSHREDLLGGTRPAPYPAAEPTRVLLLWARSFSHEPRGKVRVGQARLRSSGASRQRRSRDPADGRARAEAWS